MSVTEFYTLPPPRQEEQGGTIYFLFCLLWWDFIALKKDTMQ